MPLDLEHLGWKHSNPAAWFWIACLFEAGLLAVAAALAWLFRIPILPGSSPTAFGALIGLIGAGPPFLLFLALLKSEAAPWMEIRCFLECHVRPLFGAWSWGQLALLSVLAGVSEEVLFRGVLQNWFAAGAGTIAGLLGASLFFGLCHLITRSYALIVMLIGLYLGLLWLWTGELITPIVTHALYDFAALIYFLKSPGHFRAREGGLPPPS